MTCNVFSGTLNPTQSINQSEFVKLWVNFGILKVPDDSSATVEELELSLPQESLNQEGMIFRG